MEINKNRAILLIIIMAVAAGSLVVYLERTYPEFVPSFIPFIKHTFLEPQTPAVEQPVIAPSVKVGKFVKKFVSAEEFKEYLEEAQELAQSGWGFFGTGGIRTMSEVGVAVPMTAPSAEKNASAERVSETNVQVAGIDEPDIVKTNGKEIFYSRQSFWFYRGGPVPMPMIGERVGVSFMPPSEPETGATKIITAFPPEKLELKNKIDKQGDLLLKDNILTIFGGNEVFGYDVSDVKAPKEKWSFKLDDRSYIVSSRLYKGKIYLVVGQSVDQYKPCPITPLILKNGSLEIKCADIYHPVQPVPVDVTYTALVLNPDTGAVEKKIAFVGYSGSSMIYMSESNLYLTYTYYADTFPILVGFYAEELKDLFPAALIQKISNLEKYDISSAAKYTELMSLMESYDRGLNSDDRLKLQNELQNRQKDYFKKYIREFEFTGIAKISLDNLEIAGAGKVPGRPLNQFSLDEYKGYLRIATTLERNMFAEESANDVYVLDKNLDIAGSIKDLGLTERIYSARFVEDKGFLVTFRQTDPFYVLDLSNPAKPELKGELKIPGYSSYLHPIDSSKIIGIGKEGSYVKISLFDVSSPANPKEISKYTLEEYWSEILNTHHAFLIDKKHKVFFMPGSSGGYIFSYDGDNIKLTKAVSQISPKRALYLNDYFYVLSDNKIVVLDENTWQRVKELEF